MVQVRNEAKLRELASPALSPGGWRHVLSYYDIDIIQDAGQPVRLAHARLDSARAGACKKYHTMKFSGQKTPLAERLFNAATSQDGARWCDNHSIEITDLSHLLYVTCPTTLREKSFMRNLSHSGIGFRRREGPGATRCLYYRRRREDEDRAQREGTSAPDLQRGNLAAAKAIMVRRLKRRKRPSSLSSDMAKPSPKKRQHSGRQASVGAPGGSGWQPPFSKPGSELETLALSSFQVVNDDDNDDDNAMYSLAVGSPQIHAAVPGGSPSKLPIQVATDADDTDILGNLASVFSEDEMPLAEGLADTMFEGELLPWLDHQTDAVKHTLHVQVRAAVRLQTEAEARRVSGYDD